MAADLKSSVVDVLNSLDVAGAGLIGKLGGLDGLGFKLLGILFSIMFFYKVIIFMIDGSEKIMVEITRQMIVFSILATMLIGWTSPVNNFSVSGFFLNSIPAIAENFTPGDGNPTPEIVDKHVNAIFSLYQVIEPDDGQEAGILEKLSNSIPGVSFGKKVVQRVADGKSVTNAVVETAFEPINILISTVILLLAAFFILWSLLTFVFILNAGQVMMYVGLALGPILIPFLLIPSLAFLFDGWLRFMISAALYKVIAVLIGLLAMGAINQVVGYAASVQENLIFMSLLILFFAMLGKQLMGLADNMASAIASGGANSGGSGDAGKLIMMAPTGSGYKGNGGGGSLPSSGSGGGAVSPPPIRPKTPRVNLIK